MSNKLPFGNEFSPTKVKLIDVLEIIANHSGNESSLMDGIFQKYISSSKATEDNLTTRTYNFWLALNQYQLIDDNSHSTDFFNLLYGIRHDSVSCHQELAKHILVNLHGLTLTQTCQDILAAGERVDLTKLRIYLEERGLDVTRGSRNMSTMRLWLEKSGVFGKGWNVNEVVIQKLLGLNNHELDSISDLTYQQKVYLKTFVNLCSATHNSYKSNTIEKVAAAQWNVSFNEKMLPKQVLYPLRDRGFIKLVKTTTGRGGKPFVVYPTDLLSNGFIIPILEQFDSKADRDLRILCRRPLADVIECLESESIDVKGKALEALSFKFMRVMGLYYIGTRTRLTLTGGAEVDMLFKSKHPFVGLWQLQSKNSSQLTSDHIMRELGVANLLKSNVLVFITTGKVTEDARRQADLIIAQGNLNVFIIDGSDIRVASEDIVAIADIFGREIQHNDLIKSKKYESGLNT